jgi:hypothetical protein
MAAEFLVVFAIYPRVTQLDFTGPHEVLARLPGARCLLASSTGGDLEADGGIVFTRVQRQEEIERYERVRGAREAAIQRAAVRLAGGDSIAGPGA